MSVNSKKFISLTIVLSCLVSYAALSHISNTTSRTKETQFRPYGLTERDKAELVATRFIKEIETNDCRTAISMIEESPEFALINQIINEFCNKHQSGVMQCRLIFHPFDFTYSDSSAAMKFYIKNILEGGETKTAQLLLVKRNDRWLIRTSSDFFEVLEYSSGDKTKKGDAR